MSQRLPPLNALKAFEAAARHLSVKKAALELNVTPAAVSHQIRTLEEYLNIQLFHRYNRALELTDPARACLPKLREGFDCLGQAVERLRTHTSGGMLTVSAAPSFAARWLMPRLHRFIAAHQEIDVRISARMRRVSVDGKADVAERATIETWLDVVNVNLNGMFFCARAAIALMKKQDPQGGRIINNGSISAHAPRPFSIAYTATKHAVTGLTQSIALDTRAYRIACTQIDIGNAATEMTDRMAKGVLQPDGSTRVEPRMDVNHVADAVIQIVNFPLETNVQFMTIMATNMPFLGRG